MKKSKDITTHATIGLNGKLCGFLGRRATGKWVFTYADQYQKTACIPLSLSLPLSKGEHISKGNEILPYFLNLIPEGWLLAVAKELKVNVSSPIACLTALCRDNIGAVEIFKAGDRITPIKPSVIPTTTHKIQDLSLLPQHRRCLLCYEFLPSVGHNRGYHEPCAVKLFEQPHPPVLSFRSTDIRRLASIQLGSGHSVTGVQQKLSGYLRNERNTMILRYILKPQPTEPFFVDMVTLEVSMMHFAQFLGLKCAQTGLIYGIDGTPTLISRRFDRLEKSIKIHCEDFAQALGVDPGDKYDGGTLERAADLVLSLKAPEPIATESKQAFLKICLYNYLMGNADNHLKNFSIAHVENMGHLVSILAPFYDLVPARLFPSGDMEETGLSLAGKKSKFRLRHFRSLEKRLGVENGTVSDFISHFEKSRFMLKLILESLQVPKPRIDALDKYVSARLSDLAKP